MDWDKAHVLFRDTGMLGCFVPGSIAVAVANSKDLLHSKSLGQFSQSARYVKIVCPVHSCNAHVLLDNDAFWWPKEQTNLKSRLRFVYISPKVSLLDSSGT